MSVCTLEKPTYSCMEEKERWGVLAETEEDEDGNIVELPVDYERYNFINLQCSDIFNNELKGDYYAPEYWYFNIEFRRDYADSYRAGVVEQWLNAHQVSLIYKDTFTDMNDPDETLKTFVNGRTFV